MTVKSLLDTRGTVLVVAMLLMTILALIGIASNMNVVTDTGIASNYLSSLQSFYIAEAGLERAKTECAERFVKGNWAAFNPILRGADDTTGTVDDGILSFGSDVSFHGGRYSVTAANEPGDGGGPYTDTNATITIISKGSFGNSTSTVSTTIAMGILPYLSGSLNLVDYASASFANDEFKIDGRDYLLSDTGVPHGKSHARSGVSISDTASSETAKDEMTKSLSAEQKDNFVGAEPSPSIGTSATPSKAILLQSVDRLKRVADNKITEPPDNLTGSGPDNSITIGARSYSFGTASSPKVTYISKPSGGTISVNGSGFGILIVEGNNLCFKPAMHFSGAVILLGRNVVLDDSGSTTGLQLKGALVVAELSEAPSGYSNIVMSGHSRILYSEEALDQAKSYVMQHKKYNVLSWQRSF
jgi:hypothetical protein